MDAKQLDIAENFATLKKRGIERTGRTTPYNPLVNAAACFFDATKKPDPGKLGATQKQLLDNLDSFEQIVSHYYAEALELISIYILCFTLDTLMAYRLGQYYEHWHRYDLVKEIFQYEDANSATRMLDAIDFLCLSEEADTQLLEFAYVCMSLAIKNNASIDANINRRAEDAIDKLYKKIYDQRGGFKTKLAIKPLVSREKTSKNSDVPVWMILLLTLVTILTIFSVMSFLFNVTNKKTLESLNSTRHTTASHEKTVR